MTQNNAPELNRWTSVERCLDEARKHLETASTTEQFQAIGLLCRETLISLSQAVYNSQLHPLTDGIVPSETDAKRKLDAYLAVELAGSSNEVARRQAKTSIDFANELQHKRTSDYRDATLCLEATVGAVNLIRILAGQSTQVIAFDTRVEFSYIPIHRTDQEHLYQLEIAVLNQGKKAINNFKLEFVFPDLDSFPRKWHVFTTRSINSDPLVIIEPQDQAVSIVRERHTICVTYRSNDILFSQDKINLGDKLGFKYRINEDIFANIDDMPMIHWTLHADNFQPKEGEVSLASLNTY